MNITYEVGPVNAGVFIDHELAWSSKVDQASGRLTHLAALRELTMNVMQGLNGVIDGIDSELAEAYDIEINSIEEAFGQKWNTRNARPHQINNYQAIQDSHDWQPSLGHADRAHCRRCADDYPSPRGCPEV